MGYLTEVKVLFTNTWKWHSDSFLVGSRPPPRSQHSSQRSLICVICKTQPRVALISKRRRLCIRDGRGILHKLHILLKGFVFKVFFRILCFQNILDILEVTDWKYSWVVESLLNLPKALGSFGGEMNCYHWKQKTDYARRFPCPFMSSVKQVSLFVEPESVWVSILPSGTLVSYDIPWDGSSDLLSLCLR